MSLTRSTNFLMFNYTRMTNSTYWITAQRPRWSGLTSLFVAGRKWGDLLQGVARGYASNGTEPHRQLLMLTALSHLFLSSNRRRTQQPHHGGRSGWQWHH